MGTVLLFPTELEAAPLRRLRPDLDIRISGVGAAETARFMQRMLSAERPSLAVLCGTAGSYDPAYGIGSVVAVAEERMDGVPPQFAVTYRATADIGDLPHVAGNTVSRSVAPAAGAQIENMEGAAFFRVCKEFGIPFLELRSLSNRVGDPFAQWEIGRATEELARSLVSLLELIRQS